MIPLHWSPFANHLWQSTAFAVAAMALALVLRKNRAQIRYWLWLAASLKFLIPFSLLITAGSRFEWRSATAVAPPLSAAVEQISQPFAMPAIPPLPTEAVPAASSLMPSLLVGVWFCGFVVVLAMWWVRWRRLQSAVRSASPLAIAAPVKVIETPVLLEPGVFGVFRPILVLPEGIASRLTPEQLKAILAHELCHVRRRDNLAAAIHMVVEALFWFHPLVWWIGARLIEERERACDEEVLALGNQPQAYAEGILNVCRFYVESPLACASGVTGADLKKRIAAIMTDGTSHRLTLTRKLLLAVAGTTAVAAPILIGILNAPRIRAQATAPQLRFEVASIKPASPSDTFKARLELLPGGGLRVGNSSLMHLITFAYDVPESRVSGGPKWLETERYDILAKLEGSDSTVATGNSQGRMAQNQARERLRSLLAERFKLVIHQEAKEGPVLALVMAKGGPKIQPSKQSEDIPPGTMRSATQINARRGTMGMLCAVLSNWMRRPVLNQTGLTGNYDYVLKYAPDPGESALFPETNPSDASGPSIFTALQEQLGLKLESQRGSLDVIVIDRVEKPTEN